MQSTTDNFHESTQPTLKMASSSPFLTFLSLFLFLFLFLLPRTVATNCVDHPAYSKSLKPVLISRWEFAKRDPTPEESVYLRRYTGHTYAPYKNKKSFIYAGLDLFYPPSGPHKSIPMSFQRRATVYLFAFVSKGKFNRQKKLKLPGWRSMGWAVLVSGKDTITYGIHRTVTQSMPTYAYVFRKKATNKVVLPDTKSTRKVAGGIGYIVWIGEANGKPSPKVGTFRGRKIKSNARCPDSLHDAWVTRDPNTSDRNTRGKLFRTYHPTWDPCFWCAYDHDHGANPEGVFNYKPLYDYTAFKNNRQAESDAGFKGYIFSFNKYWVYLSLHIQASKIRRVFVRTHTMNIVIAEKKTRTVVMDIRFKADFGFVAALTNKRKLRPLNEANRRIRRRQKRLLFRTINVFNPNKPNKKLLLKKQNLRLGVYEEWQTIPMCSDPSKLQSSIQFVLKTPGSGILSLSKSGTLVPLGRLLRNTFYRSLNLNRVVKFRSIDLDARFCPGGKSGVFYTDPTGTTILNGPGRNSVRQYVKPGFSLSLSGNHGLLDSWDGIFAPHTKGVFRDHGYGLDPNVV